MQTITNQQKECILTLMRKRGLKYQFRKNNQLIAIFEKEFNIKLDQLTTNEARNIINTLNGKIKTATKHLHISYKR